MSENTVKVWDPIVRIGHWTLVIAFFTAYFTEDEFLSQHVWAGYVVGVVVCMRLIWGLMGPRHARFTDFVRSPVTVLRYVRDIINKQPKRYIGHNPAGGIMIVALLVSILGTTYSGLMLYAIEENAGPFSGWVGEFPAPSPLLLLGTNAYADDDKRDHEDEHEHEDEHDGKDDDREEFWEEIHEFFANLTLLLVALHIAGVLFSSYSHRENLIKAMITGRKQIDTD